MEREEAIRRIKAWNLDSDDMEVLATVIPELAESEDEKIRKELWEYFHELELSSDRDFSPSFTIDHILTWLEKQKDANKAIEAVERIDKYIDEHVANAHDMKDSNPDPPDPHHEYPGRKAPGHLRGGLLPRRNLQENALPSW